MVLLEYLLITLFIVIIVLLLLCKKASARAKDLEFQLKDVISRKQSLSTKYGKMTEQFLPFLESYPYDKQNFRFIGTPIDGIQFENDKIIFIEFKTANSQLTIKQKEIRNIVNKGRIEFKEFRI